MRSVFDRPGRRDRRLKEFVALCASRSSFAKGYTPAEHVSAMDCLLADLGIDEAAPNEPDEDSKHATPDVIIKSIHAEDEDDSRLHLALTC